MKKEEAKQLAPKCAELLIQYIEQFLSDDKKVNGEILINSAKIDGKNVCTFDINIDEKEEYLNTGITTDHCDILNEQILQKLIERFMESETMGVTKYYSIRGGYGMNMDGVNAVNRIGSSIKINFLCRGDLFSEQIKNYDNTLMKYTETQKENNKSR